MKRNTYLVMEQNTKNVNINSILLKPAEKRSDYSKIQILIDNKSMTPTEIKLFYKDGSKTYLKINSLTMNQIIDNNVFIFNKTDHPGVSVEDLRMN
ncbi:MAG: outer-membrane lipoprotein carrier protein LolA [Saprospiraceae bacterium]